MMLDDRGVSALGKVSEERKLRRAARAPTCCARPRCTARASGWSSPRRSPPATPVIASDIPGYRDVVRDGIDGLLVPPGDALALAEALRTLALDGAAARAMARAARERAERFAWPHVAAEVLDSYEHAIAVQATSARTSRSRLSRRLCATACASADMLARDPRPAAAEPRDAARRRRSRGRRAPRAHAAPRRRSRASSLVGARARRAGPAARRRRRASPPRCWPPSPGLLAAGLGADVRGDVRARRSPGTRSCVAAPTWRRAKRRDAMQGTFIGVLMSSTLPARLGEPSRALIVARRLGRARETLPVVLGTMVSQTLHEPARARAPRRR